MRLERECSEASTRQTGYFDTKYLNDREIGLLRGYSVLLPAWEPMRTLTTVCELRFRLKRERRLTGFLASSLEQIAALPVTKRITTAIALAKRAIGSGVTA